MRLHPALKINGQIYMGTVKDSHITIAKHNGLDEAPENTRGFSPDGQLFLTRKQALGFLEKHENETFKKLPKSALSELHSEHLAQARGIEQSEEAVSIREALTSDISTKKVLVWDRGLYLYLAQKLGESFKKVYYYIPQTSPYPCSPMAQIGTGLKEVERVYEFWKYIDKVDLIVFFDCYDGELQHWLRSKGYKVFGGGRGEKLELDKIFHMETMEELGLPVARTAVVNGLDAAEEYLEEQDGVRWLKTSHYRGDFETKKFTSMATIQPWLDEQRHKLGHRANDIEIIIQDPIEAECEAGYDGFCVDGQFTRNCLIGYEVKDCGLGAAIVPEPAPILKDINEAFSETLKKLGYRGHFSTEVRITKDGTPYFIDPTLRAPSPPSELMCEIYDNYAQMIWDIAHGVTPLPVPKAKFGVEIILTCNDAKEMEVILQIPDKYYQNVKLKNHCKRGNEYVCIPNGNGEFIGAVVCYGTAIEKCIDEIKIICDSIIADNLDFHLNIFEELQKQISNGKKFGVEF